ncbi:YhcH/YjgK/YiaL family protein [Cohnella cellulosilytica]|uniref:YhcH/YjgK/YiaL family protein n=1 Tax=Cohnella cellulosilytica TaxID=986710 RepID=A0ABW2FHA6_9BACL
MIADVLTNYRLYTGMHPNLEKGFKAIEHCLAQPLPEGNQTIEVDGLSVVVQHYRTVDRSEKKMEGHRRNLDIQYMVRGKEIIYWENTRGLTPITPYNETRDHLNYGDGTGSSPIHLADGFFAVFWPEDSHKTGCQWDEPEDIVKLIVKVRLDQE